MLIYHEEAMRFPRLEGEEREALKESLRRSKGNKSQPILYRIYQGRREGLDGRNREELCLELKLRPTYKRVDVADEDVKEFIWQKNLYRRHLTAEQAKPFIEELRANGHSIRAIAKKVGRSKSQVARDLESVPNGTTNGKNIGKMHNLIPELASLSLSPKMRPKLEVLPAGLQKDMAKLVPIHGISKAYQIVSDQRQAGEEPEKPKAGQVKFNWKEFDKHFGVVARGPDDIAKIFEEKESNEHNQCLYFLAEFRRVWDIWRKRLTHATV